MQKAKEILVAGLVAFLALSVRLPGLGSFMTADEENWMVRSGMFYHNLFRQLDPGGTFQTTHPGATTMWIAGVGIVAQEAQLGFDIDTSNLVYFRQAALLPMVIVISILLGIASWQLMQLLGAKAGLVASGVLVLEPYLVGMSQIVHLDMLLALFMLNSILAFFQIPHSKFKILPGIFAGLALATKLLPVLWLFVFFGIILLVKYRLHVSEIVRRFSFTFGIAMLIFWTVWPALWFTADLGRSFGRDIPSVIQDAHVAIEDSSEQIAPASFYVRSVLGRTSPFVLILTLGTCIAILVVWLKRIHPHLISPSPEGEKQRGWVFWLFLYALGFLLMITFAAKKADRYMLPALVVLPVVAGWGLSIAFQVSKRVTCFLLGIVFVLLFAQFFVWIPYSIAYNNPLFPIRSLSQQGWGEGLDAAAAWLNQQPQASELYVASWYPSVFQNFFHGKTFSLSSRTDSRVSYVVLYRNMYGRGQDTIASDVLDEYRDKKPVYVVNILDVPYVWVYATDSTEIFKQHAEEIFGKSRVGQLVPVTQEPWSSIEIGMANFSNRQNTQEVFLHVRENMEAQEDLRTVHVNARDIQDGMFHRFEFEPIRDSKGKTYYVFIDSPTSRLGDAVTVRFSNTDVLPGEMVKNGEVLTGRDAAYRIPQ